MKGRTGAVEITEIKFFLFIFRKESGEELNSPDHSRFQQCNWTYHTEPSLWQPPHPTHRDKRTYLTSTTFDPATKPPIFGWTIWSFALRSDSMAAIHCGLCSVDSNRFGRFDFHLPPAFGTADVFGYSASLEKSNKNFKLGFFRFRGRFHTLTWIGRR